MSPQASSAAWRAIAGGLCATPTSALVLARLAYLADAEGTVHSSYEVIAAGLGLTVRGVRKCISALASEGLVEIARRKDAVGRDLPSQFHINFGGVNDVEIGVAGGVNGCSPKAEQQGSPLGGQEHSCAVVVQEKLINIKNNNNSSPHGLQISGDFTARGLLEEREVVELRIAAGREAVFGQELLDEILGAIRARGRTGPGGIRNPLLFFRSIARARRSGGDLTYAPAERELRRARESSAIRRVAPEAPNGQQAARANVPQEFRDLVARLKQRKKGSP